MNAALSFIRFLLGIFTTQKATSNIILNGPLPHVETIEEPELYTADTTAMAASLGLMTIPNPTVASQNISALSVEFEGIIRSKPSASHGSSYNGTSVDVISKEAYSRGDYGHYVTVEFVNYLNRSIKDFGLYDPNKSAFHYAPKFIPPNTQGIFTFSEPRCCYTNVAFSYRIPNTNVRLALGLKILKERPVFEMDFVQQNATMEDYHDDPTMLLISGSTRQFSTFKRGVRTDSVYMLAYDSVITRGTLTMLSRFTGSLKIELVEVS